MHDPYIYICIGVQWVCVCAEMELLEALAPTIPTSISVEASEDCSGYGQFWFLCLDLKGVLKWYDSLLLCSFEIACLIH